MAVKKKVAVKKKGQTKKAFVKVTSKKLSKVLSKGGEKKGREEDFDYRREEINAINRLADSIKSMDQTQNALFNLLIAIFEDDEDSAKPDKSEQVGEGGIESSGTGAQGSGNVRADDVPHDPDENSGDLGDEIDKLIADD